MQIFDNLLSLRYLKKRFCKNSFTNLKKFDWVNFKKVLRVLLRYRMTVCGLFSSSFGYLFLVLVLFLNGIFRFQLPGKLLWKKFQNLWSYVNFSGRIFKIKVWNLFSCNEFEHKSWTSRVLFFSCKWLFLSVSSKLK